MNDTTFHQDKMGRDFYERTMPELVRQLHRLNENLERCSTALDLRQATEDLVVAVERVLHTEIVPGSNATRAVFRELRRTVREARDAIREFNS